MKKNMIKRVVIGLCLASIAIIGVGCGSKDYPKQKQIDVIIPKAPGGGTDVTARGLTQYMKKHIADSNFVPNNKPDGNGVTGMVNTAKAKADGYTLGMVTVELAMFPHQDKSPVTYEDFAPIVAPIADPAALIVPADAPYDTVDEFIEYAKENPEKIQVGNSGTGAIWHLAAVALEDKFDIKLTHVPYSEGTAPAVAAVSGGHIDAVVSAPSSAKSQVDAGELKILGIMADERPELFADVPTFKELGFDFSIRAWAALVAPKDTPEDILVLLRNGAKEAIADPEFQDYLKKQGIEPVDIVGDDVYTMMKNDHEYYAKLIELIE